MPENDQSDSDTKKVDGDDNSTSHAGLWWIVGAGLLGLLALIFVSVYLPNLTERAKFFTGNALSLLVLGVIAVQAYIYRKQWDTMERQWKAMIDGLEKTQTLVQQNQLAVEAAGRTATASEQGLEIGRKSMVYEQRAYVGEVTLEQSNENSNAILKFENTGKHAAEEVKAFVDAIMLVPKELVRKHGGLLKESFAYCWWFNVGPMRSKHEIEIPFEEHFNKREMELWAGGHLRLIAQVKIEYKDGFGNPDRADYAFRYHRRKWIPWPMWTVEEIDGRIAEEQSRYHPK
jgi:hypothetical protein